MVWHLHLRKFHFASSLFFSDKAVVLALLIFEYFLRRLWLQTVLMKVFDFAELGQLLWLGLKKFVRYRRLCGDISVSLTRIIRAGILEAKDSACFGGGHFIRGVFVR